MNDECSESVWIFAEQRNCKLMTSSLEILGGARKIADKMKTKLAAVLFGYDVKNSARELIAYGADKVYIADDNLLSSYHSEAYSTMLVNLIKQHNPEILLFSATAIGRDLAPTVAAKIRTGLTADCVELNINEKRKLLQIVPAFGGNMMATVICPEHKPQMATVRPGVMKNLERDRSRHGEIVKVDTSLKEEDMKIRIVEVVAEKPKVLPIEGAVVVVAGGWGVGNAENWRLIEELAEAIGGAVGATRPAVDENWALEGQMIGVGGKTVRPELYIGAGISGALQHVVGIQDSKIIVAINIDPNAPILKGADFGIVGDLREIIPCLVNAIKAL
ncbi:MAG: electron transfer flavoprotein subunit alpha/FixB family protein [Candidatus Bathyarchaeota archaeon]|nr:MAG: electron transfer flavoprotein subunit alpha/FixB family protein [Candidatus Bathyarchaeota archaeon]